MLIGVLIFFHSYLPVLSTYKFGHWDLPPHLANNILSCGFSWGACFCHWLLFCSLLPLSWPAFCVAAPAASHANAPLWRVRPRGHCLGTLLATCPCRCLGRPHLFPRTHGLLSARKRGVSGICSICLWRSEGPGGQGGRDRLRLASSDLSRHGVLSCNWTDSLLSA